jgi:hypothetical protein
MLTLHDDIRPYVRTVPIALYEKGVPLSGFAPLHATEDSVRGRGRLGRSTRGRFSSCENGAST